MEYGQAKKQAVIWGLNQRKSLRDVTFPERVRSKAGHGGEQRAAEPGAHPGVGEGEAPWLLRAGPESEA